MNRKRGLEAMKRILFGNLLLWGGLFIFAFASFPTDVQILYVDESEHSQGKTYLAIFSPQTNTSVRITQAFYSLSFPDVCETCEMIGFTNFTKNMKSEAYLIRPDGKGPFKLMDGISLEDFTPDGKSLLYITATQNPSLYLYELESKRSKKISQNLRVTSAKWSPLQDRIAVSVLTSSGTNDLYLITPDTQQIERLTNTPSFEEFYPFFTKDGKYLAFMSNASGTQRVEHINLADKKQNPTKLEGLYPSLSPDNLWTVTQSADQMILSRTNGDEQRTLGPGKTPTWISNALAEKFLNLPSR